MSAFIDCRLEDTVALVTLDKPHRMNALCADMAVQLMDTLEACATSAQVRAVLLTGRGRAFCAGSDLGADVPVADLSPSERGELLLSTYFNPLIRRLAEFPKPVVVALNGPAVGGGVGLALSGAVVVAGEQAELRLPFVPRLGLVPDMGCTWWLTRVLGRGRALAAMCLGEAISAERAAQWGLVWSVVADESLPAEAMAVARRLADGPNEAYRAVRQLVDAALESDLATQLERERATQVVLMDGPAFAEGAQAFKEKRAPRFS